jgi:hypothetical protein
MVLGKNEYRGQIRFASSPADFLCADKVLLDIGGDVHGSNGPDFIDVILGSQQTLSAGPCVSLPCVQVSDLLVAKNSRNLVRRLRLRWRSLASELSGNFVAKIEERPEIGSYGLVLVA